MKSILNNKRFLFSTLSIILVTITSICLKYNGDIYWKLIASICAVFTADNRGLIERR